MDEQVSAEESSQKNHNTYSRCPAASSFRERTNFVAHSVATYQARTDALPFSEIVEQFVKDVQSSNLVHGPSYKTRGHWEGGDARGGLTPWQKRRLHTYIFRHLGGQLYIKELAFEVSLSVSHFCRAFKEGFGKTPHAYIIQCRMQLAKQLILTTEERLSHIALLCGLADQAHLTRLFRREIGSNPGNWRRRNLLMETNSENRDGVADCKCPNEMRTGVVATFPGSGVSSSFSVK